MVSKCRTRWQNEVMGVAARSWPATRTGNSSPSGTSRGEHSGRARRPREDRGIPSLTERAPPARGSGEPPPKVLTHAHSTGRRLHCSSDGLFATAITKQPETVLLPGPRQYSMPEMAPVS